MINLQQAIRAAHDGASLPIIKHSKEANKRDKMSQQVLRDCCKELAQEYRKVQEIQ